MVASMIFLVFRFMSFTLLLLFGGCQLASHPLETTNSNSIIADLSTAQNLSFPLGNSQKLEKVPPEKCY